MKKYIVVVIIIIIYLCNLEIYVPEKYGMCFEVEV
jgi:hypothetical protein